MICSRKRKAVSGRHLLITILIITLISGVSNVGMVSGSAEIFYKKFGGLVDSVKTKKSDWLKSYTYNGVKIYNQAINNGEAAWQGKESTVHFTGEAASGATNLINYYGQADPELTRAGWTHFRKAYGVEANPDTEFWEYTNVYFNTLVCNTGTVSFLSIVAAHEIGHSLGLWHNTNGLARVDDNKYYGQTSHLMFWTGNATGRPHIEEMAAVK